MPIAATLRGLRRRAYETFVVSEDGEEDALELRRPEGETAETQTEGESEEEEEQDEEGV